MYFQSCNILYFPSSSPRTEGPGVSGQALAGMEIWSAPMAAMVQFIPVFRFVNKIVWLVACFKLVER